MYERMHNDNSMVGKKGGCIKKDDNLENVTLTCHLDE